MGGGPTGDPSRTPAMRRIARPALVAGTVAGSIALTTALFLPTLDGGFVSDDPEELLGAASSGPLSTTNLHPGRNLRPLNQWLHARTLEWFGTDPTPQHVLSLALHVLVGLAVGAAAAALCRAFRTGRDTTVGALAAVLFLVHPSHTEAVSWISARSDLLMALGLTVALAAWFGSEDRSVPATLVACAATAFALASKEPAVTFPLAVAALEAVRGGWRSARRTWPLFVVLGGYLIARLASFGTLKSEGWWSEFVGDDPLRTLANAVVTPIRAVVPGLDFGGLAVGLGLLALATTAHVRGRRPTGPQLRLGAGLGVALLVSTSLVSRLGTSPHDAGGERLVYFPSVLASTALAILLVVVAPRRPALAAGAAVAVAAATLVPSQLRWSDAAQLSADLTASARAFPRDRTTILLNGPDSLRGALVQRNSTGHDLVLVHGWRPPAPVLLLSAYEVGSADNRVEVDVGPGGRRLVVHLRSPGAHFVQVEGPDGTWDVPGSTARLLDDRTLAVDLPARGAGADEVTVWVADGSAWRRVA